ncbi:hypothetical protein BIV60_21635 [Bacillus sp. MUM 116]|uniref:hypothetical protein n=1 Tax=Bacillus sp. MUM 116 TaxID=1678002 RepID=UPI0008F5DD01|nr:hypothetical protein [Bacillus sp. MUM 116]OIK10352.1 hypothetical protein BIV60_21635 [Bacillus sp. MUM 116]
MGKLFKFVMLLVGAFVLIFIIVGVVRGIPNILNEKNAPQQQASSQPGKAEYDKIRVGNSKTGQGGMTKAEVEKIVGKPTSQTQGQSGKKVMEVYTYAASAGPNSILVTYIHGHVSGKSQTGLD